MWFSAAAGREHQVSGFHLVVKMQSASSDVYNQIMFFIDTPTHTLKSVIHSSLSNNNILAH